MAPANNRGDCRGQQNRELKDDNKNRNRARKGGGSGGGVGGRGPDVAATSAKRKASVCGTQLDLESTCVLAFVCNVTYAKYNDDVHRAYIREGWGTGKCRS